MIVGVQGSSTFSDYAIFLRAMGVALSSMKPEDTEFYVYTFGPSKINSYTAEFCNLSERGMKMRGKKIRFFKVPLEWGQQNIYSFDYFAYFSNPKEPLSKFATLIESKGIDLGVFRY